LRTTQDSAKPKPRNNPYLVDIGATTAHEMGRRQPVTPRSQRLGELEDEVDVQVPEQENPRRGTVRCAHDDADADADAATAISPASRALLSTRAMLASRLAPCVCSWKWASRNGVTSLPRIPCSSSAARPEARTPSCSSRFISCSAAIGLAYASARG